MPLKKPAARPAQAPALPAGQPPGAEGLHAASADTRWAAARALAGDAATPAAAAAAVAALDRALASEADPRVRAAMFTSLASINSPASFAAALRYLRADDAERHGEALEAMKLMPELALHNLESLLQDPDTDVRILSCELARGLAAPRAARLLAGLLRREPEVNVCATALEVLAETGAPEDLAALEVCAQRFPGAPFLGFALNIAAARIRSRSGAADA